MREEDKPTLFFGKVKILEMLNGNTKPILKIIMAAALTITAIVLGITQSGIQFFESRAVDSTRILSVERDMANFRSEHVRKDALEPRLAALESSVEEIHEAQKEQGKLLQQILWEQRRR